MRSFRLGRTFDAILMDDAISHMRTRAGFAAAFRAAFAHLNPGGVLIATPDVTTESFRQDETACTPAAGATAKGPVTAAFIQNVFDPDPADDHYEATLLYLVRRNGRLRIVTDRWRLGLFSRPMWRRVLAASGATVRQAAYAAGGTTYTVFACTMPATPAAPRTNRKARP